MNTTFFKAAKTYDRYSNIQAQVFVESLEKITVKSPALILDLGCGTGRLTLKLQKKFPKAHIIAVDNTPEMIAYAKEHHAHPQVSFIHDDLSRFKSDTKADLIVSNATLQWVPNLNGAFKSMKENLSESGQFIATLFGPDTFKELQITLNQYFKDPIALPASSFKDKETVLQAASLFFPNLSIDEKKVKYIYPSLLHLLKSIKMTGVTGKGKRGPDIWTKSTLNNLDHLYKTQFEQCLATYHVITVRS